jgi:hypothetical protein
MIVLPRISIKRRIQTQVSVARCFAALPRIQFVELAFKEWLLLAQSNLRGVGVRLDLLALSGPSLLADDGLDRLT